MSGRVDELSDRHLHWVDVDGIRTRYYEAGDGQPLVLLHGGEIGSLYSLDAWSLVLPLLARDFRVIALDRIGQGHTDNPSGDRYHPRQMLDHTLKFFGALGIHDAHVVGHSRGGLIGTWLTQHHPELVRSLVIVNSRTTAPEDSAYPNDVFYEQLGHRQRLLAGEVTRETVSVEPMAQCYDPESVTPAFIERLLEIARLPKSADARQRIRIDRETNWLLPIYDLRREALAQIDHAGLPVPTLVLWGLNDLSAPLPVAVQLFERIAARTPRAEMHVLNEARHYCFRDQPDAFARVVRGFCADVTA